MKKEPQVNDFKVRKQRRKRRLIEPVQRTAQSVRCTYEKLLAALGRHILRQLGRQIGEWQALQPDSPGAG
jgi:hypothetical protein